MLTRKLTRTSGKSISSTSCDATLQPELSAASRCCTRTGSSTRAKRSRAFCKRTRAMAYWGVAMDFLGNTLAATPSRADAQAAWDALEKALTIGAKTHCEGDCRLDVGMSGSPIIGSDAAAIALVSTNDGGPIILEMLPVHMARALSVSAPPKMTGAAA